MKKYRTSRNPAKGTRDTTRTAQGVAFKPKKYEWGNAKVGTDLTGYHRLSLEEVDFLEKYAELKADIKQIAAATGRTPKQCRKMLERPQVKAEILEIQKVWRANREMTAEHAAAFHIQLLKQLYKDYHQITDPVDRSKMANPLTKASETYLKAAGHFDHMRGAEDAQITINIDLGDSEVEVSKGREKASVRKKKAAGSADKTAEEVDGAEQAD